MTRTQSSNYTEFAVQNCRLLAFGFVMAISSTFGQTHFIGIFTPSIEAAFGLSHTEWGTIYMLGTLASAAVLPFSGSIIDRTTVRRYAIFVLLGMVMACLAMSLVPAAWALVFVIFLLRQFGQGLCQHTAVTGMIKFFGHNRGKAVAIAILGFPAGKAFLPVTAVTFITLIGWRSTYALCAVTSLLMVTIILCLVTNKSISQTSTEKAFENLPENDRGLSDMLRDPVFFMMLPALMAPAILDTAMHFHQLTIASIKGWRAEWVTGGYVIYSITTLIVSMFAGNLADRIGASRIMPFGLLPLAAGVLVVAFFDHQIWAWVYLALFGVTSGITVTCMPLLLVQIYGARHIGAIRSFAATVSVFGSAIAPPILGAGLDAEVSLLSMGILATVYVAIASVSMAYACRNVPEPR